MEDAQEIRGETGLDPNPSHAYFQHVICTLVEEKSKVLDLGCGSGDLLHLLQAQKRVEGTGVEVSEEMVYHCVQKGLSVHHGDVDAGLVDFPDACFDYVILHDTLQEVKKPDWVIREMLRVGKRGIITFPNFGYWRARTQGFFYGRTPVIPTLPYKWFETPNLHFLSINDFVRFCETRRIEIVESRFASGGASVRWLPNLFAESALFVVT